MKEWKLSIFNIKDKHNIRFHSQNTNLLPPKPKSAFRHLKQGIQESHRKYTTSLSTDDFSTLYTTLSHNLIKEKLLDLIERTFFKKEGELYLACNDKKAFFTSKDHYKGYQLWSCQNVCDALSFLLDNINIRFGTKLYRQIVGIPMGTNCAPIVAELFLLAMKEIS